MSHVIPAVLLSLLMSVFAHNSYGATFTVTNTNDDLLPGSLRHAVATANSNGQDDTINFDPAVFNTPRVILVGTGHLTIAPDNADGNLRTLTINGPGANLLELNGNDHNRIFYVIEFARLVLSGVKLSGGNGTDDGGPNVLASGGAIRVLPGGPVGTYNLTLINSIVSGNNALFNGGAGGGLAVFGSALIINSAILNNTAAGFAGGISVSGEIRMFNSTVSGNSAPSVAGGIVVSSGRLHMTNCTVARNMGGIALTESQFNLYDFFLRNSIISNNGGDVAGRIRSRGNNIIGNAAGVFFQESSPSDLVGVDPAIDLSLSTFGGVIPTHALSAGSPAVDSGDNCVLTTVASGGCSDVAITHDIRGIVRPQDADSNGTATVDRGSFEVTAAEVAAAPGVPDLDAADDSGASSTDNITAISQLSLQIGGLTTGATVELLRNGVVISTAVAAGSTIAFEDTVSTAGTYTYGARQIVGGVSSLQGGPLTVVFDNIAPAAAVNQAAGQADPTRLQPMNYSVVFNEPVLGFAVSDVSLAGSSADVSSAVIQITGTGPAYTLSINNVLSDGTVVASVAAAAVEDLAGNVSVASTSTDNSITLDTVAPTATINQAAAQMDPTRILPVNFTAVFSEPVVGFIGTDVSLEGSTVNVTNATRTITGSGATYNVAIGNVSSNGGTIVASLPAGVVQDAAGNISLASTSTDNSITLDNVGPTVTINQAAGQPDPTNMLPVNYTVVFTEPVTGFDMFDINFNNSSLDTTGATVSVTGSGTTYNVAISNLPPAVGGVLRANVRVGAGFDATGNPSSASTSTDNGVFLDTVAPSVTVNQAAGQQDPTSSQPITFTAVFSEAVSGFAFSDVSLAGSTANVSSAIVSVTGTTTFFTISVTGVTSNGTVVVTIPAGAAQDGRGNASLASTSTDNTVTLSVRARAFDFDGDSKTDIGIFRPSDGTWWVQRSSTGVTSAVNFGSATDVIAPADFTGDGKSDIAFFRPSDGNWFILRSEDSSFFSFPFGTSGDIPVPADYDNDGKADPAVFRPSTGVWFIQRSSDNGTTIQQFGANGDLPVAADYDGDGRADLAIYRPADGTWWLNRSTAGVIVANFGTSSDKPVQGDYTGDGKADVAFWRPSTGDWFILRSEDFSFFSFPFGTSGDMPAPGDYDGDGKIDPTVFRPSNATWFVERSTGGTLIQQFGATGDRPVANAFVP
ncbi:MAG TPA: FG-GAP-like repeat-containing protein [Pyrinomonadaceae bacterium]